MKQDPITQKLGAHNDDTCDDSVVNPCSPQIFGSDLE